MTTPKHSNTAAKDQWLLEEIQLRPTVTKTVTFLYSHYNSSGVKEYNALVHPITIWQFMNYEKLRATGVQIVDMELPTQDELEDDLSDLFVSASEPALLVGSE